MKKSYLLFLLSVLLSTSAFAKVKAYTLEVNMGPIFIEQYHELNNGQYFGCANNISARDCLKPMYARFKKEGATGIRFLFYLGRDGTPIQTNGQINPQWVTNMKNFLADVKAAGIMDIIPTPVWANWGYGKEIQVFDSCLGKNATYRFYKSSPYPYELATDFPYQGDSTHEGFNKSYTCAPKNPEFVGWPILYSIIDSLVGEAARIGLNVSEFDIENEINVLWFPVQARRIYDTTAPAGEGNAYGKIRQIMSSHGFDAGRVTYSLALGNSKKVGFDCTSSFGDSGRIAQLSHLYGAIQGKKFGHPEGLSVQEGLICGGTNTGDMPQIPVAQAIPTVHDIHAYSCILGDDGNCNPKNDNDVATDTVVLYNAMQAFIEKMDKKTGTFVLGETFIGAKDTDGRLCEAKGPVSAPAQIQQAFLNSKLYKTSGRTPASNIIRPWNNVNSTCEGVNTPLSPPYNNMVDENVVEPQPEPQPEPTPVPAGTFSASPNPIPVAHGEKLGVTTLSWDFPTAAGVEVRVISVNGPMLTKQGNKGTAVTGKWVTEGMVFYFVEVNTRAVLGTVVAHLEEVNPQAIFTASPNPIPVAAGETHGVTTLSWDIAGTGDVEIRVNSPTGPMLTSMGRKGRAVTGKWVSDGTQFYVVDKATRAVLATLTARLQK